MSILRWSPSFNVNIEIIDTQHQRMFELANIFYGELYNGASQEVLNEKLKELVDYSITHFETEEEMLLKANHPDLLNHAREHKQFIGELNALSAKVMAGDLVISAEIINFLRNSIINHIFVSDREMAKYFNKA